MIFGTSGHVSKEQAMNRTRLASTRVAVFSLKVSDMQDHLEVVTSLIQLLCHYDSDLRLSVDTNEGDDDLMLTVLLLPEASLCLCDVKYRLELTSKSDAMNVSPVT